MRKLLPMLLPAMLLATPLADAGEQPPAGARTVSTAPAMQPQAGGTRDPKTYFTDADLLTQDGEKVRFYSDMLKGKVVVVNMMYARCADACPLITKQLTQVRNELGEQFGSKVYFISLTTDPERDTPQALKKFAQKQDADVAGWTFLTGSKTNVNQILKRMGALADNVESHATVLYILDVDRKRMRRMLPNLPPKAIAEAARLIASADEATAGKRAQVN